MILLVGVLVGLLLAKVASHGAFGRADTQVDRWFAAHRTNDLNRTTHYVAYAADPMGLVSRRRYRWSRGRVTDYWDEVFTVDGLEGHAAVRRRLAEVDAEPLLCEKNAERLMNAEQHRNPHQCLPLARPVPRSLTKKGDPKAAFR